MDNYRDFQPSSVPKKATKMLPFLSLLNPSLPHSCCSAMQVLFVRQQRRKSYGRCMSRTQKMRKNRSTREREERIAFSLDRRVQRLKSSFFAYQSTVQSKWRALIETGMQTDRRLR